MLSFKETAKVLDQLREKASDSRDKRTHDALAVASLSIASWQDVTANCALFRDQMHAAVPTNTSLVPTELLDECVDACFTVFDNLIVSAYSQIAQYVDPDEILQ